MGPASPRMGKDRLPGSPPQEGSQARGASPHVGAKCGDPGGLARAKGDKRPSVDCLLHIPHLLLSPSSRFARSLSLCLLSLCFSLCSEGSEWPGQLGGTWGGRWLLTPFSPSDRHLWLSCHLSLQTLAGIPEAAMWVAGCVWLRAPACALSPSCPWRALPRLLTDCWMKK